MDCISEKIESNARSYSRKFPTTFVYAANEILTDTDGREYIDFLSGAGTLNFGHNNPVIKKAVTDYLNEDRILHALDLFTEAKDELFHTLNDVLLAPRGLNYKILSCGPTGTNAVEAALKLARKYTGRTNVFAFSGSFHGMSLGSLAMTADSFSRRGAGVPLNNVTFMPYFNSFDDAMLSLDYMDNVLSDDHSGIDKPAAVFLETVQAEGGINVCPVHWLKRLSAICSLHDILLIVDDIQVGVGRTGSFFSFERADIVPDMVILSKSIGGIGMPLALLMMKPELDCFDPAEHNGTFRGNQLAFVACNAAVKYYHDIDMDSIVRNKEVLIGEYLKERIMSLSPDIEIRGIGMIWGIDLSKLNKDIAADVQHGCFDDGLIIERAGRGDKVLKILCPLLITQEKLLEGIDIIAANIKKYLG